LSWSISDPTGDTLTCSLDYGDDGGVDATVSNCTSASLRSHTFTTVGTTRTRLTVSDGTLSASSVVTVNVTPPTSDGFDITLRYTGAVTPSQVAAFSAAAARWSSVVKGDLPSESLSIPANDCVLGMSALTTTVDDLFIDASVTSIDGPGGVLGMAGPCYLSDISGLPVYGIMKFDSADLAALEAGGTLMDTISHEMGHVLGIGTMWTASRLSGAGTSNPQYLGKVGNGAYQGLGRIGLAPVENSGGDGTADSHWRESVFGSELMTGWINSANSMSTVTVGALADLGYSVDLGAAEPFAFAGAWASAMSASTAVATGDEVLLTPKGSI
jgi:PKD repeat protein